MSFTDEEIRASGPKLGGPRIRQSLGLPPKEEKS